MPETLSVKVRRINDLNENEGELYQFQQKIKKNEKKLKKGLDFLQKEDIMFDVGTGSCRKTKQES